VNPITPRHIRSDERGIALVMALLMVLAVSVLTSALAFVANTEAISSLSYTSMTQVRYGAESGIHAAGNHLLFSYAPPDAVSANDPIANYDMTVSPVTFNGQPVVLSSDPAVPSIYQSGAAVNAFIADSRGTLNLNNASVDYSARATLTSMRVLTDYFTSLPITLQTWEVVGVSRVRGAGVALVEVSSVIERQAVPVFSYAAFATHKGCDALSFTGGVETGSYDSALPLVGGSPVVDNYDGNVGTNGNLAGDGDTTTINGTLSTPRAGVGDCTTNNVTASTIEGWATVEGGLVTLPQAITLPTPPPFPPPPSGNVAFNSSGGGSCPSAAPYCTSSGGVRTITPPTPSSVVSMGDVAISAGQVVHLHAGVYELNSLSLIGGAQIIVDSGPVIIKINANSTKQTPLDTSGGVVSNASMDPTDLQFIYGGTKNIKISGGTQTAALVYAPNASGQLTGGSTFYGAVVTKTVTSTGGFNLNYDRRLRNSTLTAGNPTMTTFTWRTF
jgi:hypothetical protein